MASTCAFFVQECDSGKNLLLHSCLLSLRKAFLLSQAFAEAIRSFRSRTGATERWSLPVFRQFRAHCFLLDELYIVAVVPDSEEEALFANELITRARLILRTATRGHELKKSEVRKSIREISVILEELVHGNMENCQKYSRVDSVAEKVVPPEKFSRLSREESSADRYVQKDKAFSQISSVVLPLEAFSFLRTPQSFGPSFIPPPVRDLSKSSSLNDSAFSDSTSIHVETPRTPLGTRSRSDGDVVEMTLFPESLPQTISSPDRLDSLPSLSSLSFPEEEPRRSVPLPIDLMLRESIDVGSAPHVSILVRANKHLLASSEFESSREGILSLELLVPSLESASCHVHPVVSISDPLTPSGESVPVENQSRSQSDKQSLLVAQIPISLLAVPPFKPLTLMSGKRSPTLFDSKVLIPSLSCSNWKFSQHPRNDRGPDGVKIEMRMLVEVQLSVDEAQKLGWNLSMIEICMESAFPKDGCVLCRQMTRPQGGTVTLHAEPQVKPVCSDANGSSASSQLDLTHIRVSFPASSFFVDDPSSSISIGLRLELEVNDSILSLESVSDALCKNWIVFARSTADLSLPSPGFSLSGMTSVGGEMVHRIRFRTGMFALVGNEM